jgi:hypothetical protein
MTDHGVDLVPGQKFCKAKLQSVRPPLFRESHLMIKAIFQLSTCFFLLVTATPANQVEEASELRPGNSIYGWPALDLRSSRLASTLSSSSKGKVFYG